MIGSSWFYDPPLETISPRLAYLRLNPLKGGAFIIHQGPAPIHSERASATSPTREAMIESGEYTPSSWLVAWPKSTLIPVGGTAEGRDGDGRGGVRADWTPGAPSPESSNTAPEFAIKFLQLRSIDLNLRRSSLLPLREKVAERSEVG